MNFYHCNLGNNPLQESILLLMQIEEQYGYKCIKNKNYHEKALNKVIEEGNISEFCTMKPENDEFLSSNKKLLKDKSIVENHKEFNSINNTFKLKNSEYSSERLKEYETKKILNNMNKEYKNELSCKEKYFFRQKFPNYNIKYKHSPLHIKGEGCDISNNYNHEYLSGENLTLRENSDDSNKKISKNDDEFVDINNIHQNFLKFKKNYYNSQDKIPENKNKGAREENAMDVTQDFSLSNVPLIILCNEQNGDCEIKKSKYKYIEKVHS